MAGDVAVPSIPLATPVTGDTVVGEQGGAVKRFPVDLVLSAPFVGPTPPLAPVPGREWINNTTGKRYTWYLDGTSGQWVEVAGFYYVDDAITSAAAAGALASQQAAAQSKNDAQAAQALSQAAAAQAASTISPVSVADYAGLRAYAGAAAMLNVTGYLVSAAPGGIFGVFVRDDTDTTSADNGGTIIVAANGKRWKRSYAGSVNLQWFGATGTGADDTAKIVAWLAALTKAIADGFGASGFAPRGVYGFSGVVNVPACVIHGSGMHTTVFKALNAAAQLLFAAAPGGDAIDPMGANPSFKDCTVDGATVSTGSLVKLGIINYPRFESVAIINSAGVGLELCGTQNALFDCCAINAHTGANVTLTDGVHPTFGALGAAGNLFLKCEINTYGTYAVDSSSRAFNNAFLECGIEYSTAGSLAAVRLNQTDGQVNSLRFTGGFTVVRHAIPVFTISKGTLEFDSGQAYGGGVGTALFYLNGPGLLVKTAGNCHFHGATNLFFAHNAGSFVYDLANYFNYCTNDFQTDAGALQDSCVSRPMYSMLDLRRGQIHFPAVQVPSTLPNTLDDYEEGTFTPALLCNGSAVGVTPALATGNYIKVGRLVFYSLNYAAAIAGAGAGAVTMAGLPFQASSPYPGTASISSFYGMGNGTILAAQMQGFPAQALDFYTPNVNGVAQAGNTTLKTANLGANVGITLSGCYLAQN